jgi:transcriptional regulator with XRE-family HTH domain
MEECNDPIAAAFGARLKSLREAAGLTMKQLGEKIAPPLHGTAVARYEAGKRLPSWGAVVRIAVALGVTPDAFLPEPPKKRGKS